MVCWENCSTAEPGIKNWKAIWRVEGPRVVNNFLWKACNGILPTTVNLHKRGITDDPMCPICLTEKETVSHALWTCPSTRDVWSECNLKIQNCLSFDDDFINIFEVLHERLRTDELQLVAIIARLIWLRRNTVVFGGDLSAPAELIRHGEEQIDTFWKAEKSSQSRNVVRASLGVQRWCKPAQGVVKINWDASVDKERRLVGMGIVVRDFEGKIIAALYASKQFIVDLATAEAMAAWRMVEFCINMEFGRVCMEGDCLEVIQALKSFVDDWGRYGLIVNDTKQLLRRIWYWEVQHVPRVCNKVAHNLAKLALTCEEEMLWRENFPSCILEDVTADADFLDE